MWCDVDVVEFSYFGAPAATPKEQLYTELVDGLRGSDPFIGSGSQVCSYCTFYFFLIIFEVATSLRLLLNSPEDTKIVLYPF